MTNEEIITRIEIEVNNVEHNTIDNMVKKMMTALNEQELELISRFNVLRMLAVTEAPESG